MLENTATACSQQRKKLSFLALWFPMIHHAQESFVTAKSQDNAAVSLQNNTINLSLLKWTLDLKSPQKLRLWVTVLCEDFVLCELAKYSLMIWMDLATITSPIQARKHPLNFAPQ